MTDILLIILILVLYFGGWFITFYGSLKMYEKHPGDWKCIIPAMGGILLVCLAIVIVGISGFRPFIN